MNRSRAGTPGSTISRGVSPSNTNNDDIFDTSTLRNAGKKASKRKADDASSRAGGSSTTKRKRKPDQGSGRASRPASVFSGRQGSVKGKATGGRSYAGSVVDGDDGTSSRGFPEDNRDEDEDEEDEDDEEEEVVGADVDEWNLKTPITPEQEAIAARYQETRVQLERLKPYMTQTQRARLEEVQSEKAGITFNHVQRLHRQRYDELLKATVAKVVAKTANVMIGEIVEKGKPVPYQKSVATQREKGISGPLSAEDIKEAHRALQDVSLKTGGTGVKLSVNAKKRPLFGGK